MKLLEGAVVVMRPVKHDGWVQTRESTCVELVVAISSSRYFRQTLLSIVMIWGQRSAATTE